MRNLVVLFLLLCSLNAYAINSSDVNSAGFDKLPESTKAEIIKQIADSAATANSQKTNEKIDQISKWSQLGSSIGQGLGSAAKELGMAVNEFAASPTGKLATMLLVWHFIGGVVIHVIGGVIILIFGLIGLYVIYNMAYPKNCEYDQNKTNIFGNPVLLSSVRAPLSSDAVVGFVLALFVLIIISLFTVFSY